MVVFAGVLQVVGLLCRMESLTDSPLHINISTAPNTHHKAICNLQTRRKEEIAHMSKHPQQRSHITERQGKLASHRSTYILLCDHAGSINLLRVSQTSCCSSRWRTWRPPQGSSAQPCGALCRWRCPNLSKSSRTTYTRPLHVGSRVPLHSRDTRLGFDLTGNKHDEFNVLIKLNPENFPFINFPQATEMKSFFLFLYYYYNLPASLQWHFTHNTEIIAKYNKMDGIWSVMTDGRLCLCRNCMKCNKSHRILTP